MRRVFLLLFATFSFFFQANSRAVDSRFDSLQDQLDNHVMFDSLRVNTLLELTESYVDSSQNLAIKYLDQASSISDSIGFTRGKARVAELFGDVYLKGRQFSKAMDHYLIARKQFELLQDSGKIATVNFNLGRVYNRLDSVDEAIKSINEAIIIWEKQGELIKIADSYSRIGNFFGANGNYYRSLYFRTKALDIYTSQNDIENQSKMMNNIGNVYYWIGSLEKARWHVEQAIVISRQLDDTLYISTMIHNLGAIHQKQGNYDSALYYYQKAYAINAFDDNPYMKVQNKLNIAKSLCHLGRSAEALLKFKEVEKLKLGSKSYIQLMLGYSNLACKTGDYNKALEYATLAYESAVDLTNLDLLEQSTGALAQIYKTLGNYQDAFDYMTMNHELNDSILTRNNVTRIAELENQFKYEKAIDLIEGERIRQHAQQASEIKFQRFLRNIFVIGFVIFVTLTVLAFRTVRRKRHDNALLNKQNLEIEEQSSKLELINEELRVSNLSKDKLFSIIAHDLKGPISSSMGLMQVLNKELDSFDGTEIRRFISIASDTLTNNYALLDNLLTWSKTQLGGFKYHPKDQPLKFLVENVLGSLELIRNDKEIEVELSIDDSITVFVDRDSFITVVRNLVSNALKFTHRNGRIKIEAEELDGNQVQVAIMDNGLGMSEDVLSKIFKMEESISLRGTENEKGTGLGLMICKEFVEKNGGKITVESELNKGTSFYLVMKSNQIVSSSITH